MKNKSTYCRICEPACGLDVQVNENKIVKILPDKNHPVHKGFSCHKGINFLHVHYDEDRLNYPLKRSNSKFDDKAEFEVISWNNALDGIGSRIKSIQKRYGKGSVAGFMGNPTAFNSVAFSYFPKFIEKLGSSKFFSSLTQDCSNKMAGSEAIFGTNNLHPIPDLLNTNYFLSIGSNPQISHMSFVHMTDPMGKIKSIKERGGKVVFVNPRNIESSRASTGEVLQIKPDSDVYFLAALINHIVSLPDFSLKTNLDKYRHRIKNIDGLMKFVSKYSPDRVSFVTGIDAKDICQVAEDFFRSKSACVHMSTGANMGRQGTLAYWLVHMLSLVSGNLGVEGGNIYSPGFYSTAQFGKIKSSDPFFDSPMGEMRYVANHLPGNLLHKFIDSDVDSVRALIVCAGNPILSIGGEELLRQSFRNLELLVVIDIYRNATSEFADYILPATDWLEREDVNSLGAGFQLEPYVQYTDRVVEPVKERRNEWWMFKKLEEVLKLDQELDGDSDTPFQDINKMLEAAGLSIENLRLKNSMTVTLPQPNVEGLFDNGVQHADGLIDCCPTIFSDAIEISEFIFSELADERADQLKLIGLRNNYMHNSWLHNLPTLKRGIHKENPLWMNSKDAAYRMLEQGDSILVRSRYGELVATIAIDDNLRVGVVAMTHGWGNDRSPGLSTAKCHPGVNVNRLLPSGLNSYEKISNQAHMTGIKVEVVRIGS